MSAADRIAKEAGVPHSPQESICAQCFRQRTDRSRRAFWPSRQPLESHACGRISSAAEI